MMRRRKAQPLRTVSSRCSPASLLRKGTGALRYLALSTVLVLTIAVIVAGWALRDRLRIQVGEGRGSGPPKPQASSTARPQSGLAGDAPWALAALPECFEQLTTDTGPRAFLLA